MSHEPPALPPVLPCSGMAVAGYPLDRAIDEECKEDRHERDMFNEKDTALPGLTTIKLTVICRWTRREEKNAISQDVDYALRPDSEVATVVCEPSIVRVFVAVSDLQQQYTALPLARLDRRLCSATIYEKMSDVGDLVWWPRSRYRERVRFARRLDEGLWADVTMRVGKDDKFRRDMERYTWGRCMSVVDITEIIKGTSLTDDGYLKIAMLGWGIELVSAAFRIFSFCCSHPPTRSSKPSSSSGMLWQIHWLCTEASPAGTGGPKQITIRNRFMLDVVICYLLEKHFRSESYYTHILDLFWTRHMTYKIAYYCYLAVAVAIVARPSPSVNQNIEPYATPNPIGYSPIQDDFLDWSGPPE
ncbi:hypothetical protein IW261DRAFT_1427049 [Armillaria novae-zelandiae]|uniref:Uncharacterized protein n=1 Tax=Armillaria novae-zelandiae TaxID=153914 RepID=A0AA39NHL6_9AGAR|nr:hypothetical protein IW261DRAFT_1427049 [Armillaria novae-zelandiae]